MIEASPTFTGTVKVGERHAAFCDGVQRKSPVVVSEFPAWLVARSGFRLLNVTDGNDVSRCLQPLATVAP